MTIDHPKLRMAAIQQFAADELVALEAAAAKTERASMARINAERRVRSAAGRERKAFRRELQRRGLIKRGAK